MKRFDLLNKDYKLVEKKKIWFLIPACILFVAIVAMIIFHFASGNAFNLGMDFQGGYTVNVKLSTKLTDSTYSTYKSEITDVIENLTDENGKSYNLKVASVQRQGSGEDASIYVKYKAVASDAIMEDEINPAIQEALQDRIFKIVPVVTNTDTAYMIDYGSFGLVQSTFESKKAAIEALASANGVTASDITLSENARKITFTLSAANEAITSSVLADKLSINDRYSGQAVKGDIISATVSTELLTNAILAICLSIVLMLVYIAFRFEVSSGISAIVALLHDIIVMFCFMAIFHIEINSTFIAALITILGYSINNTIIVFDRIRENSKSLYYKNSPATLIANQSIKETLMRSINTSVTTLLTIAMVAIIGVPSIRIFALPIIVGLLAGTFSSIFISPSIWALWKDRKRKLPKQESSASAPKETTATA
ncbi:MAG: protein translocase subunit SecF [Clostridiales bacterium]|nr:protein translocase subunit SecF [Clostridiales bacterium]